eukprot:270324_1
MGNCTCVCRKSTYNTIPTVNETKETDSDSDILDEFPDEYTIIESRPNKFLHELINTIQNDDIAVLYNLIANLQTGRKKIDQNTLDELIRVQKKLEPAMPEIKEEINIPQSNSKLTKFSKKVNTRDIEQCIGRIYYYKTEKQENAKELASGTGTVFKKFSDGYIAILTCAHNVVTEHGKPMYKIWFGPNPEDKNIKKMKCFACYYPNDRYEKYDAEQKHSEFDIAILIAKDKKEYYKNYDINNVICLKDSSGKIMKCEIIGYPANDDIWNSALYGMEGYVTLNSKHNKYKYIIETHDGHSGSPIFKHKSASNKDTFQESKQFIEENNDEFSIYGIHIYGGHDENGQNIGVKLDQRKK